MSIFDYIFYRWYLIYKKKDIDADIYASKVVSAYQLFTLINIVLFGSEIIGVTVPTIKYVVVLIVIFFTLNYFRYERGYDILKLEKRWGRESAEIKRRNMIILISYLVIVFLLPWIHGFATK